MQLLKTKTLTANQEAQIDRLWDEEFIQSLNGRFKTLLDGIENYLHHLLLDETGDVAGWTVQFERDGGMWFSIIVPTAQQGKGYGKRLLVSLQSGLDEFYGWVNDRDGEVKADGTAYRSPLSFYLKHGFEVLHDQRLDTEIISAVKIKWSSAKILTL